MSQNTLLDTLLIEVKEQLDNMKSKYFKDHPAKKKIITDYSWQDFLLAAWQRTDENMEPSQMMPVSGIKVFTPKTWNYDTRTKYIVDDIKHALKMALIYLKNHKLNPTLQAEISETIQILERKPCSTGKLSAAASQFETSHILSQMRTLIS